MMMKAHVVDQLDAYFEELLDAQSAEYFRDHVAECRSCSRAFAEAQESRLCMDWLAPQEAPPVPGPEFYVRVERSIEKRLTRNWFENLAGAMRPRLAYPLAFLMLLAVAWTYTAQSREPEEGLAAIEYPTTEFTQMSYTTSDIMASEDLVLSNLVELPSER